eukprot:148272-Hanusia_phi.AAC.5
MVDWARAITVSVSFALFIVPVLYCRWNAAPAIAEALMDDPAFDAVTSGLYRNIYVRRRLKRKGEAALHSGVDRAEGGVGDLQRGDVGRCVEVLVGGVAAVVLGRGAEAAVECVVPLGHQEDDDHAEDEDNGVEDAQVAVEQRLVVGLEEGVGDHKAADAADEAAEPGERRDAGVLVVPGVPQHEDVGDDHLDVEQQEAQDDDEAVARDGHGGYLSVLDVVPHRFGGGLHRVVPLHARDVILISAVLLWAVVDHQWVDLAVVHQDEAGDEEHHAHPHGLEGPLEAGVQCDGVEAQHERGEEQNLRVEDDVDDPVLLVHGLHVSLDFIILGGDLHERLLLLDAAEQVDGLEEVRESALRVDLLLHRHLVHRRVALVARAEQGDELLPHGEEDQQKRVDDVVAGHDRLADLRERRHDDGAEDDELPDDVEGPLVGGGLPGDEEEVPARVEPEGDHAHEERVPCGGEGEAHGIVAIHGHLLASLRLAEADEAGPVIERQRRLVVRIHAAVVGEVRIDGGEAVVEGDGDGGHGHVAPHARG